MVPFRHCSVPQCQPLRVAGSVKHCSFPPSLNNRQGSTLKECYGKVFLFVVLGLAIALDTAKSSDDMAPAGRVAPSLELSRKRHFGRALFGRYEESMAMAVSSSV